MKKEYAEMSEAELREALDQAVSDEYKAAGPEETPDEVKARRDEAKVRQAEVAEYLRKFEGQAES